MNFIDALPSVVFSARLSSEGEIVFEYCNQRLNHFFSITPDELKGDPDLLFNCIADPDRTNLKTSLRLAIQDQQAFQCEFEIITAENPSTWMLLQVTPSGDATNGNSVGGTITDISDSHATKVSAIEAANHFLYLQDQLPDRFYFKDRHSIFKGGNKAWLAFQGIDSLAEAMRKSDLNSGAFTPEDAQKIFSQEQEMMRTGVAIHERECHILADGSKSYADSKKVPLYNANNEVIGLVGLTRDITELVRTEQALEKAKQEAEQAAKAKSSFLAVMSHEIRTPMNGVIGCASLLGSTNLTPEQEQLVHTIQSSGESLLVIINDILDYSKIEAGKINLEKSPFQLRSLIEDCIELFSKQVSEKALDINYFIEADVPRTLNGDATRIRQIINNLIGNAIKFTHQGDVYIDVSLTKMDALNNQCGLLITIKDTGIGISEENQANLFNAFSQADSSITRKFGGTGLGLVICKKIVEQMEGTIWFSSVLGEGTTFYLNLTLDVAHCDATVDQINDVSQLNGIRVLIVDDNTTNRKVLANTVMQWGMIPFAFHSPETTLENLAFGHEYDLVMLDFCMPKTNGCDLAERIKQLPHMSNKPIIILSSATVQRDEMHHVDACLLKPVRNSILQKTIAQVMGKINAHSIIPAKSVQSLAVKNTRILIVEDNTVNQMVIAMMLKKLGYHNFSSVADGEEAVEQCKSISFDIIFMDIQMLRMDGYTAAQLIRQQTQDSKKPWIIALTAGAQKEDSERAFAAGMNAFTTKPIQLEGLKAVLAHAENSLSHFA